MHLIHCHVKGYSTSLLPQIPHTGWLNGSTITSLLEANVFGHTIRYLARSQTTAVFFKVQFLPLSFSPFILPIFSLNHKFPFSNTYVTLVSATSQISSANVISRRLSTLQSGFLLTVSTPCMRNYQRQDHTPPPGAVLNCFHRRLQPIVTLFYRHCHGCWLTATLN